jgi:dihydropyrimidinase
MNGLSRRDFVYRAGLGVTALALGASESARGSVGERRQRGLLVRGGTVVTAEESSDIDVRVRNGAISEIGPGLVPNGERVIDASGLWVLPGGIDPHAHLTQGEDTPSQYRFADHLTSGSEAAVAGGITTIGNMTYPGQGVTFREGIARDEEFVRRDAIADIMLHPVLIEPGELDEVGIQALVDAGHTSIKIFMVIPSFDQYLTDYVRVMRQAGEAGIMSVVHCEDPAIIAESTRALVEAGKSSLRYYAGSRPLLAETIATRRAIAYGEITGAPIYVVHLSAAEPLDICREARQRGLPVYVETRPLYLHFTSERFQEPDGPLFVGQPPLREAADVEALWKGLADGSVHALGSDTVAWSREQKMDPSLDIEDLRPGVPGLQEMHPVLFSEGVVKGRLSPQRFVELISANPAKLFGLYPRKGTIAVGSDADMAVWDPRETRKIELEDMFSRAGFSLFEGWEVTGWPLVTIRRGEIVYEHGRVAAEPGSGQVLRRGAAQPI